MPEDTREQGVGPIGRIDRTDLAILRILQRDGRRTYAEIGGEIGLTGELRPIHRLAHRLREAARLGFTRAIVPRHSGRGDDGGEVPGIELIRVATLREAIAAALVEGRERAHEAQPAVVPIVRSGA